MADEGKISIGPYGWFPTGQPVFDKGKATISTVASRITLQGKLIGPAWLLHRYA